MWNIRKLYKAKAVKKTGNGNPVPVVSQFVKEDKEVPHWVDMHNRDYGRINQRDIFYDIIDVQEIPAITQEAWT